MGVMMKAIIMSLIFCSIFPAAYAGTYVLVPTAQTESMCKKLGFFGEFKLVQSGKNWIIKFASGEDLGVKKKANGVYYSIVSCTMGCMGYQEVELNTKTKQFSYYNDIDRKPEECKGDFN